MYKKQKNSQVIGALNPFPRVETGRIVERCECLSEWKEITWLVKNGSCMFSIICGPENSLVFMIFFLFNFAIFRYHVLGFILHPSHRLHAS